MTLLPGIDPFPAEPAARVRASSAWFTPPEAADVLARMCWAARPRSAWRILEPSAGHGSLIEALYRDDAHSAAAIHAVELDPQSAETLRSRRWPRVTVECCDYLTRPSPAEPYDLAIMNPPYEKGSDSAFVAKAMDESIRVVALVRLAMLESQRSYERVWSRVESGDWRLISLRVFTSRPAFLPGGGESDGGKTAFVAIKMSRRHIPEDERPIGYQSGLTAVRWER